MHENTEWNTNTEDDNSCTLRLPCKMNSQLSGNSQKFPTMQISLHQISLEFLRIFGNGKLGLTLGLEFLGIPRNSKFYNFRSLRIVENFWE